VHQHGRSRATSAGTLCAHTTIKGAIIVRKRIHIVVLACLPLLMAALGLAAEPISAETVTVDPPVEAVSTPAWDGTETVSLEEAVAIAFSNSLALKLAHLNLDEAELNLRQVEANNLVRP